MKKDKPSIQFYPSDWLSDSALRACGAEARSLWIDMICLMHEGHPYGHLTLPNGGKIDARSLGHRLNIDPRKLKNLLGVLERNGVVKKTEQEIYYSKRMVEDERIRLIRANAGQKGGNPNLVNQKDNQKPTPSSSASSSASLTPLPPATGGLSNSSNDGGKSGGADYHEADVTYCSSCQYPYVAGETFDTHSCTRTLKRAGAI